MSMETCNDDRFELIGKAREKLLDCTNIESRADEMAVLDSVLFRCWQMGWLDQLRDDQGCETWGGGAMRCGGCAWFDGDGWLDEQGHGMGVCCYAPPVWAGPSLAEMHDEEWVGWLEDGWQRPKVGVAEMACHLWAEPHEKRWWER